LYIPGHNLSLATVTQNKRAGSRCQELSRFNNQPPYAPVTRNFQSPRWIPNSGRRRLREGVSSWWLASGGCRGVNDVRPRRQVTTLVQGTVFRPRVKHSYVGVCRVSKVRNRRWGYTHTLSPLLEGDYHLGANLGFV